jgi:hypothetical protein
MARIKQQYPHHRLEQPDLELGVALTAKGPQLVDLRHASTFPTHNAALIASAGLAVDIVRVDA